MSYGTWQLKVFLKIWMETVVSEVSTCSTTTSSMCVIVLAKSDGLTEDTFIPVIWIYVIEWNQHDTEGWVKQPMPRREEQMFRGGNRSILSYGLVCDRMISFWYKNSSCQKETDRQWRTDSFLWGQACSALASSPTPWTTTPSPRCSGLLCFSSKHHHLSPAN